MPSGVAASKNFTTFRIGARRRTSVATRSAIRSPRVFRNSCLVEMLDPDNGPAMSVHRGVNGIPERLRELGSNEVRIAQESRPPDGHGRHAERCPLGLNTSRV